jgi:hypothetical protein
MSRKIFPPVPFRPISGWMERRFIEKISPRFALNPQPINRRQAWSFQVSSRAAAKATRSASFPA